MRRHLRTCLAAAIILCVVYLICFVPILKDGIKFATRGSKELAQIFNISVLDDLHARCPPATSGNSTTAILPVIFTKSCNKTISMYTFNSSFSLSHIKYIDSIVNSCWGDFNQDGLDDILLVGSGQDKLFVGTPTRLKQDTKSFNITATGGSYCRFADLTSDRHLDIVRISTDNKLSVYKFTPDKGYADISKELGIKSKVRSIVSILKIFSMQILVAISSVGMLGFYDFGQIPFQNVNHMFNFAQYPLINAVVGDINGDLQMDFVSLYIDTVLEAAFNRGDSFEFVELPPMNLDGGTPTDLTLADFNNDMLPDLLVTYRMTKYNGLLLYLNKGGSTFEIVDNSRIVSASGSTKIQLVGDFNFDGSVDVLLFNHVGASLLLNAPPLTNNWIQVELVAAGDKYSLTNAIVGVIADYVTQEKIISLQALHNRLHFGLGNATVISEIYITTGHKSSKTYRVFGILPNQLVTLHTPQTLVRIDDRAFDALSARGGPQIYCENDSRRLTPAFMILGVWKAGTTALAATLAQHPQVLQPSRKELFYFNKFYPKMPMNWYWSQFPCSSNPYDVSFDATASYFYSRQVAPAVFKHLSTALFIILLRDPVERLYSHFHMSARLQSEAPGDFDVFARENVGKFRACINQEALKANDSSYIMLNETDGLNEESYFLEKDGCEEDEGVCTLLYAEKCSETHPWAPFAAGFYYFELINWLQYFPLNQFQIIHFQDFVENYEEVIEEVEIFLGLDIVPIPQVKKNLSPKREPMLDSTREFLKKFYEPYNNILYKLLDVDYGWNQE